MCEVSGRVCTCGYACPGVCVQAEAIGPPWVLFLGLHLPCFLAGSLTSLGVANQARPDQCALATYVSLPPTSQCGDHKHALSRWFGTVFITQSPELRSARLCWNHCTKSLLPGCIQTCWPLRLSTLRSRALWIVNRSSSDRDYWHSV